MGAKLRERLLALVVATVLCIAAALSVSVWHATASDCSKTQLGFVPLNDLGAGLYMGKQGGLYPNGSNLRPLAHENAGLQIAKSITPLTWRHYSRAKAKSSKRCNKRLVVAVPDLHPANADAGAD